MSSRLEEYRSGRDPGRFHHVPANDVRPVALQSHYFLSASLRTVVVLLAVVGLYVVAVGRFFAPLTEPISAYGHHHDGPIPLEQPFYLPNRDIYPMFDVDASLLSGYLEAVHSVFTWWPVLSVLVVGGVVALVLERTAGS